MKIEKFVLGSMGTNCYLLINEETKELVVVDPATCPDYLVSHIKSNGYTPKAILLTHAHFDHVMGIDGFVKEFAINGQTGKTVGEFPVDKKKKWLYFFKVYAISLAVIAGGMFLLANM